MNKGLILKSVKGPQYSELVVSLSVPLYMELGCGLRGVVKALSVLGQELGWEFPSVPHRNSIENWVKKSGYAVYKDPRQGVAPADYAMIVDESMMIGSKKLLLTLGVKATKDEQVPLGHQHVEVLGISAKPSWNSRSITEDLQKSMLKMKAAPPYVVSDNCSSLAKGIRDTGLPHIRDVGHTLGMFLERIYKNNPEFTAYMKALSGVRFQHIMNPVAHLLPPAQRTIARFLNLTAVAEGSGKMQDGFHRLTGQQQQGFGFIPRNGSLIGELTEVLGCVNQIQREIKLRGYLRTEFGKMGASPPAWNASSDVVESVWHLQSKEGFKQAVRGDGFCADSATENQSQCDEHPFVRFQEKSGERLPGPDQKVGARDPN